MEPYHAMMEQKRARAATIAEHLEILTICDMTEPIIGPTFVSDKCEVTMDSTGHRDHWKFTQFDYDLVTSTVRLVTYPNDIGVEIRLFNVPLDLYKMTLDIRSVITASQLRMVEIVKLILSGDIRPLSDMALIALKGVPWRDETPKTGHYNPGGGIDSFHEFLTEWAFQQSKRLRVGFIDPDSFSETEKLYIIYAMKNYRQVGSTGEIRPRAEALSYATWESASYTGPYGSRLRGGASTIDRLYPEWKLWQLQWDRTKFERAGVFISDPLGDAARTAWFTKSVADLDDGVVSTDSFSYNEMLYIGWRRRTPRWHRKQDKYAGPPPDRTGDSHATWGDGYHGVVPKLARLYSGEDDPDGTPAHGSPGAVYSMYRAYFMSVIGVMLNKGVKPLWMIEIWHPEWRRWREKELDREKVAVRGKRRAELISARLVYV